MNGARTQRQETNFKKAQFQIKVCSINVFKMFTITSGPATHNEFMLSCVKSNS